MTRAAKVLPAKRKRFSATDFPEAIRPGSPRMPIGANSSAEAIADALAQYERLRRAALLEIDDQFGTRELNLVIDTGGSSHFLNSGNKLAQYQLACAIRESFNIPSLSEGAELKSEQERFAARTALKVGRLSWAAAMTLVEVARKIKAQALPGNTTDMASAAAALGLPLDPTDGHVPPVSLNLNAPWVRLSTCDSHVRSAYYDCLCPLAQQSGFHLKSGSHPERFEHTEYVETKRELDELVEWADDDLMEAYEVVIVSQWRFEREDTKVRLLYARGFERSIKFFRWMETEYRSNERESTSN